MFVLIARVCQLAFELQGCRIPLLRLVSGCSSFDALLVYFGGVSRLYDAIQAL